MQGIGEYKESTDNRMNQEGRTPAKSGKAGSFNKRIHDKQQRRKSNLKGDRGQGAEEWVAQP